MTNKRGVAKILLKNGNGEVVSAAMHFPVRNLIIFYSNERQKIAYKLGDVIYGSYNEYMFGVEKDGDTDGN